MKLRDRRVLKMLKENGLQDAEVFYGPQKVWWTVVVILLAGSAALVPMIEGWFLWYSLPFIVLYMVLGFVISGRYFNSIALTDKALVIVNPNFLFRKITVFQLAQVRLVATGERRNILAACLGMLTCNYIEVDTDNSLQLFYCAGIDEHDGYYEEGLTEKTLEDFSFSLKRKNIIIRSEFRS